MGLCIRLNNYCNFRYRRWISVVLGIIELFWFSGYYYGFNSLIVVYKQLGTFSENCEEGKPCNQDKLFGIGFTVWIVCQMCLIPIGGFMMDKVGLRIVKMVSVGLYVVGTLMFAFTQKHLSTLYFPAGIFVAFGSTMTLLCNHQISSMFPNNRGIVISLLSGAFDSSSVIAFIISIRYKEFSLQNTFIIIAICSLLLGLFMALFILTEKTTDMCNLVNDQSKNKDLENETMMHNISKFNVDQEIENILQEKYPTLKSCFFSSAFVLVTLWFACGLFRFSTYLAGLFNQLEYLFPDDKDQQNDLLQLSSAFMLSGILVAPISGFIIDASHVYFKKRIIRMYESKNPTDSDLKLKVYLNHIGATGLGFMVMGMMAILTSILIMIPNKYAVYGSFLFLIILRSLLFAAVVGFCLIAFPIKYFGTVNAIVNCIAGLVSLLQNALILTSVITYNIVSMVVAVGLLISPTILFYRAFKN